jgi:hypothetical protein
MIGSGVRVSAVCERGFGDEWLRRSSNSISYSSVGARVWGETEVDFGFKGAK